jgi:hypothetical protein
VTESEHNSQRFLALNPAVLALVAAAVLLRIALSYSLPRVLGWDESAYLILGSNLLAGNGFTYSGYPELHFPPLHPIVAGLFHLLTSNFEMASKLESSIFGGLLLLPVFAMAQRIYGFQMAYFAAALLAIFPALTVNILYWGAASEPLYLFLLYGGLAVLLAGLDGSKLGMFPVAGTLLGLAYLTRPEAFVYFGIFFFLASIWLWKGVKSFVPRTWCALGLFLLPFMLLATPYIWYLHVQTGAWMISGKTNITWQMNSEQDGSMSIWNLDSSGEEINWLSPERFKEKPLQSVLMEPQGLGRRMIKHGAMLKSQFFTRTNFSWALTLLVVLGLFKQPWDLRRIRYEAFLITIILVLILVYIPFGFEVRFFTPAFPVLLMWTAKGALELGTWLRDTVALWREKAASHGYAQPVFVWLPAGMVAGYFILMISVAADQGVRAVFYGDKEAGLWLKAHTSPDAKVMAREVTVALYAERGWVAPPHTDWPRFMQYARAHNANYLVTRDPLRNEFPYLAPIAEKGTPELELIFSFEEPYKEKPIKTLIFRIVNLQ